MFRRVGVFLGLRALPLWVGDLLMVGLFALTWVDPYRFGPGIPGDINALLVFEGLAIHSTPFILVSRAGYLPKLIIWIYVPFALMVGSLIESPLLLILFLWHLAGVLWRDGMTEAQMNVAIFRYVGVAVAFILLPFFLYIVPMPELGWVEDVIPSDVAWEKGNGDTQYHMPIAFVTIYFTVRALWNVMWWHFDRTGATAQIAEAASR
jgi:hypothetical protein